MVTVRLPTRDHYKASVLIFILQGFLFFVGASVSDEHGFWVGLANVAMLSSLLYLVSAIGPETEKQ